jgi:hypothetical protein
MKRIHNQSIRHAFVLASISLLVLITGCDGISEKSENQASRLEEFEVFGAKHNEAVGQTREALHSEKESNSIQITHQNVSSALQSTNVYAELGHHREVERSRAEFGKDLKRRLVKTGSMTASKASEKASEGFELKDLQQANVLSDIQMSYIEEIQGLSDAQSVERVAQRAAQELGKAGNIILIYAVTYQHSLEYWKKHQGEWRELVSSETANSAYAKGTIDWSKVAGADAGGAAAGAIGGVWSAVQSGAASASLTFGPQGAVITITGSAISGAVSVGATASVVSATSQLAK